MAANSSIEWTDATLNVVLGCSKISPGCKNCYAAQLAATRLKHLPQYKDLAMRKGDHYEWTGRAHVWIAALNQIFNWRKPKKIFLTSMGDPFHESITDKELKLMFGAMLLNQRHTFQILTKRPERMRQFMLSNNAHTCLETLQDPEFDGLIGEDNRLKLEPVDHRKLIAWPPPHIWFGTSVENRACAQERIPVLCDTPAAVRWLSMEPLLEYVDLGPWIGPIDCRSGPECQWRGWGHDLHPCDSSMDNCDHEGCREETARHCPSCGSASHTGLVESREQNPDMHPIDWVVVGGESGADARQTDIGWIRSVVDQCERAQVPVFVKQLGKMPFVTLNTELDQEADQLLTFPKHVQVVPNVFSQYYLTKFHDSKVSDPQEWPKDLQVRQFPR